MKYLILALTLAGCSTIPHYKTRVSGIIGCPSEEVLIQKEPQVTMSGVRNFEVMCRGKKFYCSVDTNISVNGFGYISQGKEEVNCKEELASR